MKCTRLNEECAAGEEAGLADQWSGVAISSTEKQITSVECGVVQKPNKAMPSISPMPPIPSNAYSWLGKKNKNKTSFVNFWRYWSYRSCRSFESDMNRGFDGGYGGSYGWKWVFVYFLADWWVVLGHEIRNAELRRVENTLRGNTWSEIIVAQCSSLLLLVIASTYLSTKRCVWWLYIIKPMLFYTTRPIRTHAVKCISQTDDVMFNNRNTTDLITTMEESSGKNEVYNDRTVQAFESGTWHTLDVDVPVPINTKKLHRIAPDLRNTTVKSTTFQLFWL